MAASALVLFDIDGTLIRRAGPHHRQALEQAIREVAGLETTTDGIPVQGMLDLDIVRQMMAAAGAADEAIGAALPEVFRRAEAIYERACPELSAALCPGTEAALSLLCDAGVVLALVTGNLEAIGWRKVERAGIRRFFRFGAFSGMGATRAELARIAIEYAAQEGWTGERSRISLVGDHPNDIRAAKLNNIRSIAVATGVVGAEELRLHAPDLLLPDLCSLRLEMVTQ